MLTEEEIQAAKANAGNCAFKINNEWELRVRYDGRD